MKARGNDFDSLKSGSAKIVGHPARAALDIRLMLALGADARNPQEFAQLCKMRVAATFDKFSKAHRRPSGARSPFQKMNSDHLAMKRGGRLIAEVRMGPVAAPTYSMTARSPSTSERDRRKESIGSTAYAFEWATIRKLSRYPA